MNSNKKHVAKRTMSAVMAGCMVLGSSAALAADLSKTDISPNHWAAEALSEFIDKGYLSGYGDNTYKPDQKVIRAEFVSLVNKVKGYSEKSDKISKYTDVKEGDWCYDALSAALQAGYLTGTSSTTLSPNAQLTREQAFTMIAHVLGLEDGTREDLNGFPDADKVSDWAVPFVGALVREGVVSGRSDSSGGTVVLAPQATLTRAEAVAVLRESLKAEDEYVYVKMNIPYANFYAAEINNEDAVDAVTSATNNKSIKNGDGELVAGTYNDYNADAWAAGTQTEVNIKGVSYPVAVRKTDLDKLPKADNAQADYYYTELDSKPSVYKIASFDGDTLSLGEAQGETIALKGTGVSLSTSTAWGDYQMEIDTDAFENATVYGVVLSAEKDGETVTYGMRQEENIWRKTEIAWSSGIKTAEPHGNTLNYEHYVGLMGSTVKRVTYYTDQGKYTVDTDVYVPVKFTNTFAVESAAADSGSSAVTMTDFPADYDAEYTVTNAGGETTTGFSCDGSTLTWTGTPAAGTYTLTVSDAGGKYAGFSATFQLQTEAIVAAYDAENIKLVKASDATDEAFANYLTNISSVKVGETSYNASGRGSVRIIKEDGTIDLTAKSRDTAVFEAGKTYAVEVTAAGYTNSLSFELKVPDETPAAQTLTGTATVLNGDEEFETGDYQIMVDVVVEGGVVQSVALNNGTVIDETNQKYSNYAFNGRTKGDKEYASIPSQYIGKTVEDAAETEVDVVSGATYSSNAIADAVKDALN